MDLKRQAAERAIQRVQSGMTLGLGTGTTAGHFVDLLGLHLRSGRLRDVRAVPTSQATAVKAFDHGIPLIALADLAPRGGVPLLDLAVDGADEIDPDMNLIKGLGRALLREKIVEYHAERFVIVADESKLVPTLGSRGPLPVEVTPFAASVTAHWLAQIGSRAELVREPDGSLAMTENGNHLVHCWFKGGIADPYALARTLEARPGIVEHGLFLNMATEIIVAGQAGITTKERVECR